MGTANKIILHKILIANYGRNHIGLTEIGRNEGLKELFLWIRDSLHTTGPSSLAA